MKTETKKAIEGSVKWGLGLAAGIGVECVVGAVMNSIVPTPTKLVSKVCMGVGKYVVTVAAGLGTEKLAEKTFDDVRELVNGLKEIVEDKKSEVLEVSTEI